MHDTVLQLDVIAARGRKRPYAGFTTWPPDRASLMALTDLGMSNACIARYFKVSLSHVLTLRYAYGLDAPKAS